MKWRTARFRTLVRDSLKQPPGGSFAANTTAWQFVLKIRKVMA